MNRYSELIIYTVLCVLLFFLWSGVYKYLEKSVINSVKSDIEKCMPVWESNVFYCREQILINRKGYSHFIPSSQVDNYVNCVRSVVENIK